MRKPLLNIPEHRRAVVIKNRLAAQRSFIKKKVNSSIELVKKTKTNVLSNKPIETKFRKTLVNPSFNNIEIKCQNLNQI